MNSDGLKFKELKRKTLNLHPEVVLEDLISHRTRKVIKKVLLTLVFIFPASYILAGTALGVSGDTILGLTFISLALWLIVFAVDAFYYSHYFKSVLRTSSQDSLLLSFELASVLAKSDPGDITFSFLDTAFGQSLMMRLGISSDEMINFRASRTTPLTGRTFVMSGYAGLVDYVRSIYNQDKEFSDFLFSKNIQEKEFIGAATWILRMVKSSRISDRWWGRNSLSRKGSIGSGWAYGRAFELEKFGYPIEGSSQFGVGGGDFYHESELGSLVNVLLRSRESNAVLVGEEGVGKMDMIHELAGRISAGEIGGSLRDKRIMSLDTNSLIASMGDKQSFESTLIKIFYQATRAGNIILVIPNFPSFISSASLVGSDVVSIIYPFLDSGALQVVALSGTDDFHKSLEANSQLMKRFERVMVKSGNKQAILKLVENEAIRLENQAGVMFTYPALLAVEEGAERYFSEGSLLDKALDMLSETVPAVKRRGGSVVSKEDVTALIESKTGISLGAASSEVEKDKLLNMEEILHKRVIGQDEAVKAISGAVRRGRSGIASSSKPIGSFLFLGPTGVGKTETAKALAEVFFGDENKMMRLDMSEFNSEDSMDRLIGSFEGERAGILSSMIRENPYGVLLLDEFEKTHRKVLDLFLQVFDEGVFSDMSGKKVNARNLIFVATSNAGSEIIWNTVKEGRVLSEEKDSVIESIIQGGVFKPELLNRFDGVILFHPLEDSHLKEVSKKQLEALRQRIREKGIDLVINDSLVEYVAQKGTDPKFGARPINRVIKEEIEELIAEKIISGEAKPGSKLEFKQSDLEGE